MERAASCGSSKAPERGAGTEANVYALVEELSSRLKENQITVVGNGSACVVGGHAYIIKKGQRFITNSAIASMGYDLPAAIGTFVASRDPNTRRSRQPERILSC